MGSDNSDSQSYTLQTTLDFGEQNHRKRRRNRMRVSCLNCYASKRKCDRKRPCTRCIKHGLTGLCVYELDDPTSRDGGNNDENTRLRYRIAELESVIRELNNRPHPRWLAPGGVTHDPDLVELRRSRRRGKADYVRSASVDAFFAAIADAGEDVKVKVEQDGFAPEFTPSELSFPADPSRSPVDSPLTPLSPLSHDSPVSISGPFSISSASTTSSQSKAFSPSPVSALFSLSDAPYCDASEPPQPTSNFVQDTQDGADNHHSKSRTNGLSSAASSSSEEGPPLAMLFPSQSEPMSCVLSCGSSEPSRSSQPSSEHLARSSIGIQASAAPTRLPSVAPSPSPPAFPSDMRNDESDCRCLTDATVYNPMVFFASALRTSREALEGLHPSSSKCILFRRIVDLDEHIFSASPPTPNRSQTHLPPRDLGGSSIHSTQEPTLTPSSPPTNSHDSPIRHPHSYGLPFYSQPLTLYPSVHQPPESFQHVFDSEGFAYPPETSGYSQLRGWI